MRALLDVNVLIALLDADHSLHRRAHEWFGAQMHAGWASCPITQNGCVRVMSHPGYPNALPVSAIVERLADATASVQHQFWPDDVSVLDRDLIDSTRVHGPRQLTDLYLLALAIRHGGRFVTFDRSIPLQAVMSAKAGDLVIL
jgi:toxin-antitoxin system PIN domain toxin